MSKNYILLTHPAFTSNWVYDYWIQWKENKDQLNLPKWKPNDKKNRDTKFSRP